MGFKKLFKSTDDTELDILRSAIDNKESEMGKDSATSVEIKKIIKIVEDFISKKNLLCYGGTAINNILPKKDQFYDLSKEIPDYDFFSPNALDHAKELANIYYKLGYNEVEAKSGKHLGTYKVFVNYTPIADITQTDEGLFNKLCKHSITVNHIKYCPPNYLRMSLYLEFSRPEGDISRWEKILKRMNLLNKHYPIKAKKCDKFKKFNREFTSSKNTESIFNIVKNFLIDQGVIFFGGFAFSNYSIFMSKNDKSKFHNTPDFDVISTDAEKTVSLLIAYLESKDIEDVHHERHEGIDEVVPVHHEIKIGKDTVAFIYESDACYSYNTVQIDKRTAKIATIDTILSLYLAFMYADKPYFNYDKLTCMSKLIHDIQLKNRTSNKGLLKRFQTKCDGTQATRESMKKDKSDAFQKLKDKKNSREYEIWFLNYRPDFLYTKKNNSITITPKKTVEIKNDEIKEAVHSISKSVKKSKKVAPKSKKVTKTKKVAKKYKKTVKKPVKKIKKKTVKKSKNFLSRLFK